jgi:hypothetical protein
MSTKGKPHPERIPRDMWPDYEEPEPTKLERVIDGAGAGGGWMFSNLELEVDLRADGGPLALRALAELERLQSEYRHAVTYLRRHAKREREDKTAIASGPRRDSFTKAKLLEAVGKWVKESYVDKDEPVTRRGWKTAVAKELGTRWSTLEKHLPAWRLTEPEIVERMLEMVEKRKQRPTR